VNSKVEENGKMSGRCKKFENRRRMSSAGGHRGEERGREAGHVTPKFLILIQKQ
jgi:hypothetical protein